MRADGASALGRGLFLIKRKKWSLSRRSIAARRRGSDAADRRARLQGLGIIVENRAVVATASDPTRGVLLPPSRRASRPDARRRWRPAAPMAIAT